MKYFMFAILFLLTTPLIAESLPIFVDPPAVTHQPPGTTEPAKVTEVDVHPMYLVRVKGIYDEDSVTSDALYRIPAYVQAKSTGRPSVEGEYATNMILNFAYTIWAETPPGRKSSVNSMQNIASVIRNRVYSEYYPDTYIEVLHQPGAFPVWGADGVTQLRPVNDDLAKFKAAIIVSLMMYNGDSEVISEAVEYIKINRMDAYRQYFRTLVVDEYAGLAFVTFNSTV